jgi:hypothetical protein
MWATMGSLTMRFSKKAQISFKFCLARLKQMFVGPSA